MGKALVIKGVDFTDNKLTTVTLLNDKSCYDISLDESTLTLQNIGTTKTLVATVLPVDTTDIVTWSSSDSRVASVDQAGVVTVKGAGTATITATCGTQVATCAVTTTVSIVGDNMLKRRFARNGSTVDAKNAMVQVSGEQTNDYYAIEYSATKQKETYYRIFDGNTTPELIVYPIYFGHANKLNITAPNNIKVTVFITDSQHAPAGGVDWGSKNKDIARWVLADENSYDSNVQNGNRLIENIPSDADSMVFAIKKDTNDLTLADLANVTVVAS